MSTKPMAHSTTETSHPFSESAKEYAATPNLKKEESIEAHSEKPSKPFPFWIWLGTVAISFVAGKYFVFGHSADHGTIDLQAAAGTRIPEGGLVVTAGSAVSRPVDRKVQAVGTLNGFEEVVVSSKVEGRVLRIHHDLAATVKPGDLLLELDPIDAELAVQQAEKMLQTELTKWGFSEVPEVQADLTNLPSVVSARLRYEHAASRLARMRPLHASNAISVDDMEQMRSDTSVLESDWRNQLLLANSAVATARLRAAELAIAKQRLSDCQIRVPFPTITEKSQEEYYSITERLVSEGTLLRPGTEVFRLVLGRSLKLRLAVPEVNAGKVRVGQRVTVQVASTPDLQPGTVTTISPAIDRRSRTFLVEVTLPNESGVCKPGGFAKADIFVEGNSEALMVPMESVYSLAGNHKIFLMENGIAKEYKVTLGIQDDTWVEIASPDIPVGARVITSGQRLLSEGIPVVERSGAPEADSSNAVNSNNGGAK